MAVIVIHLTDLQLGQLDESILQRAELVIDAALSPVPEVDEVHIVLSGDIVRSGSKAQFDAAAQFVGRLLQAIEERGGVTAQVFAVAGNHDCDFSIDQSLRNVLISGVRNTSGPISSKVASELSSVLENFYSFQDVVCERVKRFGPWYSTARSSGKNPIQYVLLNSAVLSQQKEEMGKLFVPVPVDMTESAGARTIYVMHHPYSWLIPDNARELAQHAGVAGDLFLMGNEDELWAQRVRDLYEDSSIYYVRGKAFNSSEGTKSRFQTIHIDTESGFLPRLFSWTGAKYEMEPAVAEQEYVNWPSQSGLEKLAFSAEGYKSLNSSGANFSHRRKDTITLQDVFVWPEVKRDQKHKENAGTLSERSDLDAETLVSDFDSLGSVVVVKGGEQSGKSALARSLALHLSRRNVFPVLLEASNVSSWREKNLSQRLNNAVDFYYGKGNRGRYKQLEPKNKVLIIDDFDIGQVTTGYFEGLKALRQNFGRIILMLDSYPGAELALAEFLRDENFVDSDIFELLPSTYHHRLQLIERWLAIGSSGETSPDDLRVTAAKLSKVVDETLGRNLIPAVPLFVLIVLQRAELAADLDTVVKSGSHGFLYESLITQAISTRVVVANVVTSLTYLTALADKMMREGEDSISESDFLTFHAGHCDRYALNLPLAPFRSQLESAEILDSRAGDIRFRYPFHNYYFQAKALSSIEDWAILSPKVDALVSTIHTERSANILLFLAHLRRNPQIGEKVLARAKGMFNSYGEADLFSTNETISRFNFPAIRQILFEGSRALKVEAYGEDEKLADQGSRDLTLVAERRLREKLDDALAMNAAFKTLQVLGQILRNHAGETEREEKLAFTSTCVGLGFRVLGFLFDMVDCHGDEMIAFRALQLRQEMPDANDAELASELERYLPGLVASITVGTTIKLANAIGSEDLEIVLDEALAGNPSHRLLRLVTQLEHFSEFPREVVLAFEREVLDGGQVLPYAVLRRFIIRRFYLFPVREELKRSVCGRFGIPILPFSFLEQKKLPSSRP